MSAIPIPRSASYRTEDIQVLEGLEPVRKRPAMYIGGVDAKGLHHLAWEIRDNAVDEYINPKHKKSGLELVLTVLHAGGKFGDTDSGYMHSGGLHGVGASVVNALSKKLIATVKRDGFEYQQKYAKGIPQGTVEKLGPFRGH